MTRRISGSPHARVWGKEGLLVALLLVLAQCCPCEGEAATRETAPPVGQPSASRDVVVTQGPAGDPLYANSWAVIVGVNRFQDRKVPPLNYAVNDATSMTRALQSLGFPESNIVTLVDEQATKAEIERMLSSVLRRRAGPQDRVFVFFATHGVTLPFPGGGEEGYLLPHDADPDDLPLTALSMSQLKLIGQRLPAKHILVAVDACYGGYSLVRAQAPSVFDQRYLDLISRSRVLQVIAAGKKDQPVIEDQGHGVFTRKLLDGLAGHADTNRDGLITLNELAAWLHPRVAQASDYKQDVQWGSLDGEGQFVFLVPREPVGAPGSSPSPPSAATPALPPLGALLSPTLGSLAIAARLPGIAVTLDDSPLGETKTGRRLVIHDLAPGTYRLAARKADHAPWAQEVTVITGQQAAVTIDLRPLTGREPPPRAERPIYTLGEKWIRNDGTFALVKITDDRYVFAAPDGREIYLTKDLVIAGVRRGGAEVGFEPPPAITWPLEVGKWGNASGVWRHASSPQGVPSNLIWSVDSFEQVSVAAGSFGSFRIEFLMQPAGNQTTTLRLWYAPEIRQFIKGEAIGFPWIEGFHITAVDSPKQQQTTATRHRVTEE